MDAMKKAFEQFDERGVSEADAQIIINHFFGTDRQRAVLRYVRDKLCIRILWLATKEQARKIASELKNYKEIV